MSSQVLCLFVQNQVNKVNLFLHWNECCGGAISIQQSLVISKEFAEKITRKRKLYGSQFLRDEIVLLNRFLAVYYQLSDVYVVAILDNETDTPFAGYKMLDDVKELFLAACRGYEISHSMLERKYGELCLSLEELVNGEDIDYVINYVLPRKLIDTADQVPIVKDNVMEIERETILNKRWDKAKVIAQDHNLAFDILSAFEVSTGVSENEAALDLQRRQDLNLLFGSSYKPSAITEEEPVIEEPTKQQQQQQQQQQQDIDFGAYTTTTTTTTPKPPPATTTTATATKRTFPPPPPPSISVAFESDDAMFGRPPPPMPVIPTTSGSMSPPLQPQPQQPFGQQQQQFQPEEDLFASDDAWGFRSSNAKMPPPPPMLQQQLPLTVTVTEVVHLQFRGTEVASYSVVGEIGVKPYLFDISATLAQPVHSFTINIALKDEAAAEDRFERIECNPKFASKLSWSSFKCEIPSSSFDLANPNNALVMVKYKSASSLMKPVIPVRAVASTQIQTSPVRTINFMIKYAVNPNLEHPLRDLSFLVTPIKEQQQQQQQGQQLVQGVQTRPEGVWNAAQQKLLWKIPSAVPTPEPVKLMAKFQLATNTSLPAASFFDAPSAMPDLSSLKPGPVLVKFSSEGSSLLGVRVMEGGGSNPVFLGGVEYSLKSGKYSITEF